MRRDSRGRFVSRAATSAHHWDAEAVIALVIIVGAYAWAITAIARVAGAL